MEYKTYGIDLDSDLVRELLGIEDRNLKALRNIYKIDISFRDNSFKLADVDDEKFNIFKRHIHKLIDLLKKKKQLNEDDVYETYSQSDDSDSDKYTPITYSFGGRPIFPKTKNQNRLIKAISKYDLVFAVGPAGTGKTYLAVAMAVQAYKKGEVKKIVLTRPAVEAGENLGFLPGDLKEKVDPYLMPLYDALNDLLGNQQFMKMLERNVIEIIPLAFMRGRTLNDSFIILDEAQNTTNSQMLMFLTRLGKNSKMVVNGDITQIDLPIKKEASGLIIAMNRLQNIEGIAMVNLDRSDVVRSILVQRIIDAYAK